MGAAHPHVDGVAVLRLPLGDEPEEARTTWAAVAHAVLEFEPVTMVVDPVALPDAQRHLDPRVEIVQAQLDDAWMRDIGPTFVLDEQGALGAVDWVFNGWGAQAVGELGARREDRRHRRRARRGHAASPHRWSTRAAASTSTARARC